MKRRIWKIAYQTPGGKIRERVHEGSLFDFLRAMPRDTYIIEDPEDITNKAVKTNEILDRMIAYSQGAKDE